MGAEIARSLIAFDVCAGAYFILLALMDTGYMQFDTRIHVLLVVMLAWILLDVNVLSRRKWVANADRHSPSQQRKHSNNNTTYVTKAVLRCNCNGLRARAVAYCAVRTAPCLTA
jgi:hypothetical protein